MGTIASPVDSPVMITTGRDYYYVIPASEPGITSVAATGTNFTVTTLSTGRAAMLKIKYTAAITGTSESHGLDLVATFGDGTEASQTLTFAVISDSLGPSQVHIPNITNPSSI